jgi:hypothetical protein
MLRIFISYLKFLSFLIRSYKTREMILKRKIEIRETFMIWKQDITKL